MAKMAAWEKKRSGRRDAGNAGGVRGSGLTRRSFVSSGRCFDDVRLLAARACHEAAKQERQARMVKVEVASSEVIGQFTLSLANGRRIESSWRFAEAELARLIRIAEARDVRASCLD